MISLMHEPYFARPCLQPSDRVAHTSPSVGEQTAPPSPVPSYSKVFLFSPPASVCIESGGEGDPVSPSYTRDRGAEDTLFSPSTAVVLTAGDARQGLGKGFLRAGTHERKEAKGEDSFDAGDPVLFRSCRSFFNRAADLFPASRP